MIIAGEASGDLHGAKLVEAMKERNPSLHFFGIGGSALRHEGVDLLLDAAELSVVGITEVISKIPAILFGLKTARRALVKLRPHLLILIDFPDFNLHVAAFAKRVGIPVLYYISPQIWAWRQGRARKIARLIDHMAVILPFEEAFFKNHNVPVSFVGHPLMDQVCNAGAVDQFDHPVKGFLTVGLVPGSRGGEVMRHLPVMIGAARLIAERFKAVRFLVSLAASVDRGMVERLIQEYGANLDIELVADGVENVFSRSHANIVASGTVTLQAAICGAPMVVIYSVSPLSYRLGKALIKVPWISLVNLIAEKPVVRELIQHEANPVQITEEVCRMLEHPDVIDDMKRDFGEICRRLGGSGASVRVAEIALGLAGRKV